MLKTLEILKIRFYYFIPTSKVIERENFGVKLFMNYSLYALIAF